MEIDGAAPEPSGNWAQMVTAIAERLPPNDAAALRFVDNLSAALLNAVKLSAPVPPWLFALRFARPDARTDMTREQRDRFICLVAATDVVPNLELAMAWAGRAPNQLHLEAAASAGALASCAWLVHPDRSPLMVDSVGLLSAAAKAGREAVCAWCLKHYPGLEAVGGQWVARAAFAALKGGHVALAEWLLPKAGVYAPGRSLFPPLLHDMLDAALEGCDLEAVQVLCGRYGMPDVERSGCLLAALCSRTQDWEAKAEWLVGLGAEPLPFMYCCVDSLPAADALERFAWLQAKDCRPEPAAVRFAVEAGNVAALEFFLVQGVQVAGLPLQRSAWEAARAGHLGALQVLHQAGCALEPALMAEGAATGARLQVLQWVWNTFEWEGRLGPELFSWAARSGDTQVIRLVRDEFDCSMAPNAWARAVESGNEAALGLLQELGCPKPDTGEPYAAALIPEEWRLLPVLRAHGLPFGPPDQMLFERAIEWGAPLQSLKWLLKAGCPQPDWCAALTAAEERRELYRCAGGVHEAAAVLAWVRVRQGWCDVGRRLWLRVWALGEKHTACLGLRLRPRDEAEVRLLRAVIAASGVWSASVFLLAAWLSRPRLR